MAILYAFPTLPVDVLSASLANGSQRYPLKTRTAQDRHEDASDFWSAVGGQYKASFNYVVTLSCEAGVSLERGPEVRTATTRLFDRDSRAATMHELHRSGGTVVDADGAGVRNVWVHLRPTASAREASPSRPAAPTARRSRASSRSRARESSSRCLSVTVTRRDCAGHGW
jgi:hypothetical protein